MAKFFRLLLEALRGDEQHYTTGSIDRAIFLLSIPMILELAMESLFAVVDIFFVSRVSVDAVATVGLTESVLTIIYSIAWGFSMAATAIIARRIGEEHPDAASGTAVQVLSVSAIFGLVIAIVGMIFAPEILRLMGGSDQLIASGHGYTRIMFASNVSIILLFVCNAIFRGAGNAAIAMRVLIVSNIINIILDPILIFGWGPIPAFGVEGAAIATTTGRTIGVLYQLYILWKGAAIIKIVRKHLIVQWDIIRNFLSISVGGAGQFLIASASWVFLVRIISTFGSEQVAGYTIAIRIIIFTIMPSWGIANAGATLVGQNLGAAQPDRAEESVWRAAYLNTLFLLGVSVLFFVFAPQLISIFDDAPTVVQSGAMGLRILCIGYPFFSYGMVIAQAFNGAGDTQTPTRLNFICFWLMEIPIAWLLAMQWGMGPSGVYTSAAVSESFLALLCIWVFRKGKWKLMEV